MHPQTEKRVKRAPRYLILGILTVAPLWVTWLVFDFIFRQLSSIGAPWVRALARNAQASLPGAADIIVLPVFLSTLAAVVTIVVLWAIGWFASNVIGQRVIHLLERLVLNVPLVAAIYGGTKRFLAAIKEKPAGVQRVVLISFPTSEMKAVGFVTRVINDADTGEDLAAVYVPTSPNPTSGYIEIVPVVDTVPTDWSMDEAMSFVMTGGATSPDRIHFRTPAERVQRAGANPQQAAADFTNARTGETP